MVTPVWTVKVFVKLIIYIFQFVSNVIWGEDVCESPSTTWKAVALGYKATSYDFQGFNFEYFYIPIPLAFLMLGLRYSLESCLFAPIGASLGIKNSRLKKAPGNTVLDKAYSSGKAINQKQIQEMAKQLDWTERNVERWLRLRKGQDKPSTLVKFCENCWKFSFYLASFICGLVNLWGTPWLSDTKECWYLYPHQEIPDGILWHSMITLTFYWSAFFSHFSDVKRRDFWQMFVHHIATIILISLSWASNLHLIGSLIFLAHDSGDVFLEAFKMAKYTGYQKVCDVTFGMFVVVWVISRLVVLPFWLIRSTLIEAPKIALKFSGYYVLNGLLLLLLTLHVFWSYLIVQLVHKALGAGKIERDVRSSSSDLSEAEDSKSTQ